VQRSSKLTFVTTSWDDGDCADLKLAELLRRKGISGTFYVPIKYRERPLSHSDLCSLASQGFEIGAHGCTHKLLWRLQPEEVRQEVKPCKQALEDILGKAVEMFCYPAGRYDGNTIRVLKESGYRGARTVQMLATQLTFQPFLMPTTLQVYPHAPFTYIKNMARSRRLENLRSCFVEALRLGSWVELGKGLFDAALKQGGVWHLYGHSWEIEKLGLWEGLGELLDYVSKRTDVCYVPNSLLLQPKPPRTFSP
jgi:peptidoglycan-N-acetylglucosamine deacetylase